MVMACEVLGGCCAQYWMMWAWKAAVHHSDMKIGVSP